MINIADTRNITTTEHLWYDYLKKYLYNKDTKSSISRFDRIKNSINTFKIKESKKQRKIKRQDRILIVKILNLYEHFFNKIICANKKSLFKIKDLYKNSINEKSDCHIFLKKTFDKLYTDFTNKYAYNILERLNIRTCPYCNRQYVFTNSGNFKTRPEFDHFLNKSRYPILAVSFYNLIPSCHTCNHGKGINNVLINPYFDKFNCKFELQNKKGKRLSPSAIYKIKADDKINLGFSKPSLEEESNIKNLGLSDLYNKHDDYIKDLIEKSIVYNKTYSMGLISTFQGAGYTPQDVQDFIWNKYLDLAKHEQHPLSKLTRDLLLQLGIITE